MLQMRKGNETNKQKLEIYSTEMERNGNMLMMMMMIERYDNELSSA